MKIKVTALAVYDIALAAALIAWFILPVSIGPVPVSPDEGFAPLVYRNWELPFKVAPLLFAIYLVPAFALYRIAAFFTPLAQKKLSKPEGIFESSARAVITTVATAGNIVPLLYFADSISWFLYMPPVAIVSAGIATVSQISAVVLLLRLINRTNPVFVEYKEFRKKNRDSTETDNKRAAFFAVLFKIRTKLFVSFIGMTCIILTIMSLILLRNYRITLLKAVGDGATSQVEQATATYRINLGDSIAMFEYLSRQAELNENAEFSWLDLTLYTNLRSSVYADDKDKDLANFRAEYSTLEPTLQFPEMEKLSPELALEALTSGSREINPNGATITYISPIMRTDSVRTADGTVRKDRVLGFSVMNFNRDVIMRPYYRTRISVFAYTIIFIYLSVIMTYLIGNYIVNPLLFLRMNVRKISNILSDMIRGQARISSSALVYNDTITSRDEIKHLSGEINDMVTVIRGIVPYISASTLKQAETGNASTERKDLAFLFTDIRGFTTLCEGKEPEEVVTILNRYLDLETEIIINNHGDVDKFVGDEMMAFFEGPQKEENACRAAMQIRHAMMEEKERREKEGLPIVSIGIGINSGPVVFGSVGARDRMDFTSIGDTVNLAARLEGANKAYGSKSLISETVYEKIKDSFVCRELDLITVKGKNEPVRIFEILQESAKINPKLLEIKNLFEKGLAAYRKCKWDVAAAAFRKNAQAYQDAPSAAYLERVEHFMKNPPPENWDGVFRMTVK